jgi:hypothetical protein
MKRSSRPSVSANLSESVHRRLNMYALAATAAGVSALALAQPGQAKIVYTPANVRLTNKPFPLDLNHDGRVDFYLLHYYLFGSGGTNTLLACHVPQIGTHAIFCVNSTDTMNSTNAIRAIENNRAYGADLPSGATIRHGDLFPKKAPVKLGQLKSFSNPRWYGPWVNDGKGVKNRYLGIRFRINGRFHFGWARMTVTTTSNSFTATLTGYAYETIPGKGIVAGKTKGSDVVVAPATLGHLAGGASAIPRWRVKQTNADNVQ